MDLFGEGKHARTPRVSPLGTPFEDGLYIFKVSIRRAWRRIAIPATYTLSNLANAILSAFEFDDDHLFCFTYQSASGRDVTIGHPAMDEHPNTNEVKIGNLPPQARAAMVFTYDFGDNWEFNIKLEAFDPADPSVKDSSVIESRGKAPVQYPGAD